MFFSVYVSSAVVPFSSSELVHLLDTSRRNNAGLGVTGMLLYKDGNFMQVLEGEEATVRALYARIERDPRHRGLLTLLQGTSEQREFAEWSMAFRNLDAADAAAAPGYSEFLNTPLTSQAFVADPSRCQQLLTVFKRAM